MSKDMQAAKDELVDGFTSYFEQAPNKRADASYFVRSSEEELRDISFGAKDIARANMLQHWAYVELQKYAFEDVVLETGTATVAESTATCTKSHFGFCHISLITLIY